VSKSFNDRRVLEKELDTSWRNKGHIHEEIVGFPKVCPDCHGYGYVEDVDGNEHECFTCNGEGVIFSD
jgi:DnaJ-class molecular chaperone